MNISYFPGFGIVVENKTLTCENRGGNQIFDSRTSSKEECERMCSADTECGFIVTNANGKRCEHYKSCATMRDTGDKEKWVYQKSKNGK